MHLPEAQIEERIIGYDAREDWLTPDRDWTGRRKQDFLYRLDVIKPLSVDTRVWPTIFASESRPTPRGFNGFQDCWADLFDLIGQVTRIFDEKPNRAWHLIAITLLLGKHSQDNQVPWELRLPPVNPDRRGEGWVFMGYDVADQWLLSGLANCGFLPGLDDVQKLRAEWGPRLNKFHLFRSFDDALLFKRFSDQRLRDDHAPFFIFGLWAVGEL